MVRIEKLESYTIPMFGSKRTLPYGKLVIVDDTDWVKKLVDIKETENGDQYFTFKRRRYYVQNMGTLNFPNFCIIEEFEV